MDREGLANIADSVVGTAFPELEVGKQLSKHAPTMLMMPILLVAVLLAVIGLIVLSTGSKTTGAVLTVLGVLLGGGAFFMMYRIEGQKRH